MNKIKVLDQHTIDKIAAGEVVERPSSVVKELVENAIDAGATAVTVEITDGGKKLIRITDNGSGIPSDQVRTAFLSHATSKIKTLEDLLSIASLGFRGEALSSIAAVSCVELITKTPSSLSGTRYLIEGGKEKKFEEVGAPDGTTFLVRNLFYNTPARSKFLKSDTTEANYISALLEQMCLSHPEVSFKYIQNKQIKLHTSGNSNRKDAIYSIYGRDIAQSLMEVTYKNDFMEITGFIGKPEIARGNRSFENYYINGRYVKNKVLAKAIEDGYKNFLMQHKFPFVSLQIEMDGSVLDVNVHPSKMEVRFARETEVYEALRSVIFDTLSGRELIPKVSVGSREPSLQQEPPQKSERNAVEKESFFTRKRPSAASFSTSNVPPVYHRKREETTLQEDPSPYRTTTVSGKAAPSEAPAGSRTEASIAPPAAVPSLEKQASLMSNPLSSEEETLFQSPKEKALEAPKPSIPEETSPVTKTGKEAVPEQMTLFSDTLLTKEARARHKLIGQLFDTYWLVQFEDQFYIIDQHAAHEKIYYERFVKEFREHSAASQYLNPAMIVSLNLHEEELLLSNMNYFTDFGFEIEHFGGREYAISAVPVDLYHMNENELFLEMLDQLSEGHSKDALDIFTMRLATMACKAAVKGNHRMSPAEANQLIDELLSLENPYNCPHGRPTIIVMSKTEIEKKFKRIV